MNRTAINSPVLEKIEPEMGQSFALRKFDSINPNAQPFWHFHPELEIVYVKDGFGKRHIGNHISCYQGGELILLGPNLPHFGFTDRMNGDGLEIVVQMKEDFLGQDFFKSYELQVIDQLIEKSKAGISFYGNTKELVGARLESMFHMDQFEKLIELIHILYILAQSKEYEILNVMGVTLVIQGQDTDRIDIIYKYVRDNFKENINLEEVASYVNMAVPSFCRYFKKVTNKTFTEFVNEFRIVHACKLLNEERYTISEISYECGFNNFSYFNRVFKNKTNKSPNEYRKALEKIVFDGCFIG